MKSQTTSKNKDSWESQSQGASNATAPQQEIMHLNKNALAKPSSVPLDLRDMPKKTAPFHWAHYLYLPLFSCAFSRTSNGVFFSAWYFA